MKRIVFIILISIVSVACSDRREASSFQGGVPMDKDAAELSYVKSPPYTDQTNVTERKLIKNGNISFETSDLKKTKSSIDALCKELGAYVSEENQNNYNHRLEYAQTIRVAADKFDQLIQKIEGDAEKVDSKNINLQDVTAEFIDVEARLKTKKELEERYREILKQAKTVEDIMNIEGQIGSVRSEIESMEGRLKYLNNQVAYSTLHITYYESIGTDFGFGSKAGNALGSGWDAFLRFLIAMITLWPFLFLIVIVYWVIARWRKRRRKKTDQ